MVEGELMEICFYKYTGRWQGMLSPGGEKYRHRGAEAQKYRIRNDPETYRLLF